MKMRKPFRFFLKNLFTRIQMTEFQIENVSSMTLKFPYRNP